MSHHCQWFGHHTRIKSDIQDNVTKYGIEKGSTEMSEMNEKNMLLQSLKTIAKAVLQQSGDISTEVHIQDLGFDSKSLVIFTDEISGILDEEIHPGVLFEFTTLDKFADYLMTYQTSAVKRLLTVSSPLTFTENAYTAGMSQDIKQHLPVIIGGGIAGMLISHQLIQDKIPHIIIGKPEIGDMPKLGESMTEVVSIEFARRFKNMSRHFYPKEFTPFFMGELVAGLRFHFFESLASLFMEEDIPKHFIHIDRLGFDKALYDKVIAAPECIWIEALVEHVEYAEDSDRVSLLQLSNGQIIQPFYVWDCTNHIRLLGRKIGLPYTELDSRREVIFTHYYQRAGSKLCDSNELPWIHATSLLSADEEFDQLKGVSWLIPMGSYVSVGISMLPEDIRDRTAEEIIALLTKAYQRRGLDYSTHFTCRREVVSLPTQHFMYERFTGKNWALVGGSGTSTWFTSGSNLSIATFMSSIASKIIQSPEIYGEYYSTHVSGFAKTQTIYDTFMESNIGAVDALKFLSGVVEQARNRITSFFLLDEIDGKTSGKVARELWQENITVDKEYLDFLRQIATHARPEERQQQTNLIFQKLMQLKLIEQQVRLPYLKDSKVRQEKPQLFI
ncbi:phosphopantetheine-binding protein [Xenorhabdus budapestensis]|uniref:phosphopantetheine-binding protein n=1 Tax=Xenorhabdus budapestensis TaxID=290110 RepID=UPI003A85F4A3